MEAWVSSGSLADARMAMVHNKVSLSKSWTMMLSDTGETVCRIAMSFALYARALDLLQKALDCWCE